MDTLILFSGPAIVAVLKWATAAAIVTIVCLAIREANKDGWF